MLVVALNVGPLFFTFVPSLNDDVCEPSAVKEIWITHGAVLLLLKQTFVFVFICHEYAHVKMHFSMENMQVMYVGSIKKNIDTNIRSYLELLCRISYIQSVVVHGPRRWEWKMLPLFIMKVAHPCCRTICEEKILIQSITICQLLQSGYQSSIQRPCGWLHKASFNHVVDSVGRAPQSSSGGARRPTEFFRGGATWEKNNWKSMIQIISRTSTVVVT